MRIDREFPEGLLRSALGKGADMAEVYMKTSRTISAEAKGGEVESVGTSVGLGYGLRVIKDGRLGFSYSTDCSEKDVVVETAIESSGYTEADRYLGLPEPLRPAAPEAPEVYDPAVDAVRETEAIEKACLIERSSLQEDPRIRKVRKASAFFSSGETFIINSKGVSYGYPSTYCNAQVMSVAEDGGDSQTGWDFQMGRFLSDVSFLSVGKNSARRALRMLGARRMEASGKLPVLLDGLVASEFLSVFSSMLSSEEVQKGRSLLKGRLGEKIVSGSMDLVDDGLMRHGAGTRHVDDEGVPTSRNVLVHEGSLRGFMYNTHTAAKDGLASTGNAVRGGFSSVPSVGPMNLYLSPSGDPPGFDDMMAGMQSGLYVMDAMGIHTANRISGEFSIGVSGLLIEGGEVRYPIREAVISGNLLEFFKGVEAVAGDLRFYGNIGSPSLLLGPVDISA
jgi:PmbA protein